MTGYLSVMRHGYRIFPWLLILAALALLAGCQQDALDDRQLIMQRIQEMARAAENRQTSQFGEAIHHDFLGQGKFRKANLAGLLMLHFRQQQSISVSLSDIQIVLNGEKADISMVAQLSGQGGWLAQGRQLQIQSRWLKTDEGWQVERARWQNNP